MKAAALWSSSGRSRSSSFWVVSAPASASAARRRMASTFSYSSMICSETVQSSFTVGRSSKHSALPSQWYASTIRRAAAMRSSQVCLEGASLRAVRRRESASEMPRTRSGLPTFARNDPVTGAVAANSAEVKGVRHTCMGWTRVGSSSGLARNTMSVPSSKREYPWHAMGAATSFRMRLYG